MSTDDLHAHEAAILSVHPDAFEIATTGAFQAWVSQQSPDVQRVAQQGTAAEVIQMLNRYKSSAGGASPENTAPQQKRLPPIFTRQQIKEMSHEEFQRREEEIDKAVAAGRIT